MKPLSRVRLLTTPWTAAHQAPPSMGFSRQEYWSGLPCPPQGDLPNPGIKLAFLVSPDLAGGFFTTSATWRRRHWHFTPVLLPGNPMDGEAWWAAVHGVAKSRARLNDSTFAFHFHALEKEMATHSSVLAWRIPGTGEPDGRLSAGSHRVGHN